MYIKHSYYATTLSSDELYHWKYKDKYRGPSGDWVYVYDDGSMSTGGIVQNTTDRGKDTYITNPKRLFDSKTVKYNKSGGEKGVLIKDGKASITDTPEKYDTIKTYGKLHMKRMDLERRISDVKDDVVSRGKKLLGFSKKPKKSEPYNPPDRTLVAKPMKTKPRSTNVASNKSFIAKKKKRFGFFR